MSTILRGFLTAVILLAAAAFASAADKTIIVLDASGSMWAQIDGRPKLEIAREALRSVLQSLPADREIGFMAYGHRQKGSCDDIELIVPPAAGTAASITAAADQMKFLGKTPLSAAVRQAAEALKYTEDKATVILITDGLETCNADPCALGKELEEKGVDFTAHVVGFGLTADEGKQVACLAENTGGKYIAAGDADQLKEALTETVVAEPPPAPEPEPAPAPAPATPEFNFMPDVALAAASPSLPADAGNAWEIYKVAPDGSRGEYVTTDYGNKYRTNLAAGDYIVVAKYDLASVEQRVTVKAGEVSKPRFNLDAGVLIIHPRPSPGADVEGGAAVLIDPPGDGDTTNYGNTRVTVPAGDIKLTVTIGQGSVSETIPVKAGETIEKDIVVGVGHALLNAYYVPGSKVDGNGIGFKVFKPEKKIDGTREQVTYAYGSDSKIDLPGGDYVAVAELDRAVAEAPFSVKVGENVAVDVTLNAGVLAITAPGAKTVKVYEAKKDIQGNRKEVSYGFDANFQTTLVAGDYVVEVDREAAGGLKEMPATVRAGERTEVAVP